ncbi:MAG: tRNA (adenosine(37)-N6)-dimethylallyltransferase MiaA, partial [Planctomycetes bacterium]|nr:tRNA (adenosine(37)-N6)-dimethylallyltransferase MiaA [Planctomycetota bacterium]
TQWDQQRTRYNCVFIGLRRPLKDKNHHTNERVRRMIDAGLVDEVRALLAEPEPLSETARKALGYAEIIDHVEGRASLAEAVEMIKINTRQFAKAQRTWFKRFRETEWVDLALDSTAGQVADDLLQRRGLAWKA